MEQRYIHPTIHECKLSVYNELKEYTDKIQAQLESKEITHTQCLQLLPPVEIFEIINRGFTNAWKIKEKKANSNDN